MESNLKSKSLNAADFHTEVDDVFGRIPTRYYLLCDLFSFGIHRIWKRRVAKLIADESWLNLLDVASGTGDIIIRILSQNRLLPEQRITASDISPKMLALAQKRLHSYNQNVETKILDAHSIPSITTNSVDLYSISFGLKICNRSKTLLEAYRVLKPGGRIIILEASNIPVKWIHNLYLLYMSLCMPLIGLIATKGDASAYKYLLQGVKEFPKAEELQKELESFGFKDVRFERLTFGIVAIHIARKPHQDEA